MNETVFDVLLYLFDHCLDKEVNFSVNEELLMNELEAVGFGTREIHSAFNWLYGLQCLNQSSASASFNNPASFRLFTPEEAKRISPKCQGFLLFLQQCDIIDASTRELIIDRVMALAEREVDLDTFKWITLMVLFTCQEETPTEWLEEIFFSEQSELPN